MNDKEIVLFTEAVQLAKDEFFIDAINKFDQLILSFPDSELCDDAYYNKGLCYFKSISGDRNIFSYNCSLCCRNQLDIRSSRLLGRL